MHSAPVTGICVLPHEQFPDRYIVTCSNDGWLKVFDMSAKKTVAQREKAHGGAEITCSLLFEDRLLLTGGNDKLIFAWQAESLEPRFKLKGHANRISDMKKVTSQFLLSSSFDQTIKLWNISNQSLVKEWSEHKHPINRVELLTSDSPIQKLFMSSSDDKTVKIWDIEAKSSKQTLVGSSQCYSIIQLSTDQLLASYIDGTVIKWSLADGSKMATKKIHDAYIPMMLKFDEHVILTISSEGQLKLIDDDKFDLMNKFQYKVGFKSIYLTQSKSLIFLGLNSGLVLQIK